MGKIIAICNQKGGVGKTTTCVNLAAGFGVLDKKVLIIDTDPQANATISCGFSSKKVENPTLKFMNFSSVIKNNTITTNFPNVDLLPYFEDLDFFEYNLGDSRFKKALESIQKIYDFIIIDCIPFLKSKNLDILISSDAVIIPIQCDYYALEGLNKFLKTIRHVQKNLNPSLKIEGFLLTMYDNRVGLSKRVVAYIRDCFKDLVFDTLINRNSKIPQAQSYGQSIIEYDVSSVGARDYLQLANEIIEKNNRSLDTVEDSTSIDDVDIIEEESVFNKKTLFEQSEELKNNYDTLINKLFNSLTNKEDTQKIVSVNNVKTLVGLSKYEIKKEFGLDENKVDDNVWLYKLNITGFFKKKYLYIYFKDNYVVRCVKRRTRKK